MPPQALAAALSSSKGFLARAFGIAVALNFVWEMAHMPLYENMPFDELSSWLLCLRASLGDGIIVLTIWASGFLLYRERHWLKPRADRILVLLACGAAIAILIEIHAIRTTRWAYSSYMPIVPGVEVGLSPLVQMLLLPFVSIALGARVSGGHERA